MNEKPQTLILNQKFQLLEVEKNGDLAYDRERERENADPRERFKRPSSPRR